MKCRHKLLLSILFMFITFLISAENSVEMIFIDSGEYFRGVQDGVNNPVRLVKLESFWISKKEISYALYYEYAISIDPTNTWNGFSRLLEVNKATQDLDFVIPADWPIWHVDYFDAMMFCNWLSTKDGFQPFHGRAVLGTVILKFSGMNRQMDIGFQLRQNGNMLLGQEDVMRKLCPRILKFKNQ